MFVDKCASTQRTDGVDLLRCQKNGGHVARGDNWHQDGTTRWDDAEANVVPSGARTIEFDITTNAQETHA